MSSPPRTGETGWAVVEDCRDVGRLGRVLPTGPLVRSLVVQSVLSAFGTGTLPPSSHPAARAAERYSLRLTRVA